jgi:multicomponent Na+:H+ antiporter subunit F
VPVSELYLTVAIFLLLNILAGLLRILRGPTPADRMLAAQLFGTTGVAILLLLAEAFGQPALRDVALIFVLLGALAAVAFVKRFWSRVDSGRPPEGEGEP